MSTAEIKAELATLRASDATHLAALRANAIRRKALQQECSHPELEQGRSSDGQITCWVCEEVRPAQQQELSL